MVTIAITNAFFRGTKVVCFDGANCRTFAKTDAMKGFSVTGNLVDVHQKKIYKAEITVEGERIVKIKTSPPGPAHPDLPGGKAILSQPLPFNDTEPNSAFSNSEAQAPLGRRGAGGEAALTEAINLTQNTASSNPTITSSHQIEELLKSAPAPPSTTLLERHLSEAKDGNVVRGGEVFILPGFIDAHIHIESSMLTPSEFARLAVVHGTVATVSDPHEIANVCGAAGVEFMIEDGATVPFKFNFGAPSCVPATTFETAGAALDSGEVEALLRREDVLYLTEMMNFPGVLHGDAEVAKKIAAAKRWNKPVDGHAPGLRGAEAARYIAAGISTDHECFTAEEALDKLAQGMKIIIREGSAAKNFDALINLMNDYPERMMFCSDDKHPDSLVEGHINQLCARAVAKGVDVFKVLQAACVAPVTHYGLKVGLLRENDFADFIVVKDLENFEVLQTYVAGELVAESGKSLIAKKAPATGKAINNFSCTKKAPKDFAVLYEGQKSIPVIEALDGQLITNKLQLPPKVEGGLMVSDTAADVLKIVVVNRYTDAPIAKAFIKNFGLKSGAIASSVAHDSHNIVAVGVDDESLCRAVNLIIEERGGVSWADLTPGPSPGNLERGGLRTQPLTDNNDQVSNRTQNEVQAQAPSPRGEGWGEAAPSKSNESSTNTTSQTPTQTSSFPLKELIKSAPATPSTSLLERGPGGEVLPLPVAGLMSSEDGYLVAEKYAAMDKAAKALGSTLSAPFMTLSFMALLVIPHLKLSDKGLFDGDAFEIL